MKKLFKELGLELTENQEKQFNRYYNILVEENKKYNLTAITGYEEVIIKHFYDSLTLTKVINFLEVGNICDVGTGAGFPGIPLKIIFPHLRVSLVESQTKKTTFLKMVVKDLNLDNVEVVNKRAEDFADTNKNSFDVVTARAVSPLNILSELCIPLIKVGGHFIAMKGISYKNELNIANSGIITLGGQLKLSVNFDLPNNNGSRTLIVVEKVKEVEGYPRAYAQIKRKPL